MYISIEHDSLYYAAVYVVAGLYTASLIKDLSSCIYGRHTGITCCWVGIKVCLYTLKTLFAIKNKLYIYIFF